MVRELEASLQQFGEFLLTAQLVTEKAAPQCVPWGRRFLTRPASREPVADQVQRFCEELRIYLVNFLHRTDWHRRPQSLIVDEQGRTSPLAALEDVRARIRTRHSAYKTECSDAAWVRRFFAYASERQQAPHPAPYLDAAVIAWPALIGTVSG